MCLNEKRIKEGFDHKKLREITIKYNSNHGKHRFKLVDQPRKCNTILIKEKLAIKVIMDFKTSSAHKFRPAYTFKQHDFIE